MVMRAYARTAGPERRRLVPGWPEGLPLRFVAATPTHRKLHYLKTPRGYPSDVARSLFMKMAEIVVTLQCQKAWLDKHLRESEYLELEAQPLPLDEIAPANLAARVHQQFLLELASNTTSVEVVANGAWLGRVVHRVMASH